jgi:hypothetical protein
MTSVEYFHTTVCNYGMKKKYNSRISFFLCDLQSSYVLLEIPLNLIKFIIT